MQVKKAEKLLNGMWKTLFNGCGEQLVQLLMTTWKDWHISR